MELPSVGAFFCPPFLVEHSHWQGFVKEEADSPEKTDQERD